MESIETQTRVVILQHPRESDVGINTAGIAARALQNAQLHVGIRFSESAPWYRNSDRPVGLLYPGDDAVDISVNPPTEPVTLVVIDGTWAQARSLVNRNPWIKNLPRFAFTPRAPSQYQIRREPKPNYVSTIEAIAYALSLLERNAALEEQLLKPFLAMVAAQVEYARTHTSKRHTSPHRDGRKRGEPALKLPYIMRQRPQDLVCVTAEANGWPHASPLYDRHELVQWTARRQATGETFEAMIAPRRPLCPATPEHARIDGETLKAGMPLETFFGQWQAFLRPTDILCFWGPYAQNLFDQACAEGPFETYRLTHPCLDMRAVTRAKLGKVGTMADARALLTKDREVPALPRLAHGRAGDRLNDLSVIVQALLSA